MSVTHRQIDFWGKKPLEYVEGEARSVTQPARMLRRGKSFVPAENLRAVPWSSSLPPSHYTNYVSSILQTVQNI